MNINYIDDSIIDFNKNIIYRYNGFIDNLIPELP